MGLRYRKSIKVVPGVKINLNRKSTSITVGGKSYRKTFNSNGQTTTSVNLPVKGLSYTERKSGASSKYKSNAPVAAVSFTPATSTANTKKPLRVKENKVTVQTVLSDPPTIGVACIGVFIIVVGFFASGASIPIGIIVALFGIYFIYAYISHKKHPDNGKYISNDQLARWRQLLSLSSGTTYDLKKKSLSVLLNLKATAEEYCNHLPETAEALLNTQQKIIDLSEFVIIKGDNPKQDYDKYNALIAKSQK